MKQLGAYIKMSLILLCFGVSSLYAEAVFVSGDYTTAGFVDGDLVVINGSVVINSSGGLTVNGDLKVSTGFVYLSPSAGALHVLGDIIITNTSGNASIIVHDDIRASGAIITKSFTGEADITTTGASSGGIISAENIVAQGIEKANVFAKSDIAVAARLDLTSTQSDAFLESLEGKINAGTVTTNAYNKAYCKGKSITIADSLGTKSKMHDAFVMTTEGAIYARTITTSAYTNAQLYAENRVTVKDSISLNSVDDRADVYVNSGDLVAGSITTHAKTFGTVRAQSGDVTVKGNIRAYSNTSSAPVLVLGDIMAGNIFTDAQTDALIYGSSIDVLGMVNAVSATGDAYIKTTTGSISAHSITTSASNGDAYLDSNQDIDVPGTIKTYARGLSKQAYVLARNGIVKANHIITDGSGSSYVMSSTGSVDVKGIIKTNSSSSSAYVSSVNDIIAQSIETYGLDAAHVDSSSGSINVLGPIVTKSVNSTSYIKALLGSLSAGRIKTDAPAGQDDSIQALAEGGHFKLDLNKDDADQSLIIKNAEFSLDADHEWKTQLTLQGTCTLNGNGNLLTLQGGGNIVVDTNSALLLKNVDIRNLGGNVIRCVDDTATLSLDSVILTQTSDYVFANGSLQFFGDCLVRGAGKAFDYQSSGISTIHEYATLAFDYGVTLSYNASLENRIAMTNANSRLNFIGSTLYAAENIRFTQGTLVFDDIIDFSTSAGKTIYFGNGSVPTNIHFEFQGMSNINALGTIVNVNV